MIDSCIYVSIKVSFSLFCQPCHTYIQFYHESLATILPPINLEIFQKWEVNTAQNVPTGGIECETKKHIRETKKNNCRLNVSGELVYQDFRRTNR